MDCLRAVTRRGLQWPLLRIFVVTRQNRGHYTPWQVYPDAAVSSPPPWAFPDPCIPVMVPCWCPLLQGVTSVRCQAVQARSAYRQGCQGWCCPAFPREIPVSAQGDGEYMEARGQAFKPRREPVIYSVPLQAPGLGVQGQHHPGGHRDGDRTARSQPQVTSPHGPLCRQYASPVILPIRGGPRFRPPFQFQMDCSSLYSSLIT